MELITVLFPNTMEQESPSPITILGDFIVILGISYLMFVVDHN